MVLAVLPMVELVGIAEGVHDGLKERFQNFVFASLMSWQDVCDKA